jgi:general secretion pathway protein L
MAITTKPISFFANATQNALSFWYWWTHQLGAMVPKRVAMAFAGDASLTDIAIEDTALVRVKVGTGDNVPAQELKRLPFVPRDIAGMRAALDEVMRGEGRDVRVLVSPQHVLRKRVVLPMATEENLRDVVGFDMDRQTPFTAEQVYFGAAVVARDVARDRIEAEVVVVPKNALEPWLKEMRAAAISVHSIVAADEFTSASKRNVAPIELLSKSAGVARRWSNIQRINVGLLSLALFLILLAVVLPIWQKREMVKELMPLAAKAESEFKITQRVTEDYTRLANEYNYVVSRKHINFPMVMLVDEITKISPDTMWIQNFEYKSLAKTRELQLAGEAASVSKVMESLEQTGFLQNTVQRQASRQGSRPNIEYFTLASDVKSRPLPEALATDALAAPQLAQESAPLVVIPPPIPPTSALGTTPVTPNRTPTATITPLAGPSAGATGANVPLVGMAPPPVVQPQAVPPSPPQAISNVPPPASTATAPPVASAATPAPAKAPIPTTGPGNSPTPIPFPPVSSPITPMSSLPGVTPTTPVPAAPPKVKTP